MKRLVIEMKNVFSKLERGRPARNKNHEAGETTSAPMFFHAN
jgi:hypothetical protein